MTSEPQRIIIIVGGTQMTNFNTEFIVDGVTGLSGDENENCSSHVLQHVSHNLKSKRDMHALLTANTINAPDFCLMSKSNELEKILAYR